MNCVCLCVAVCVLVANVWYCVCVTAVCVGMAVGLVGLVDCYHVGVYLEMCNRGGAWCCLCVCIVLCLHVVLFFRVMFLCFSECGCMCG